VRVREQDRGTRRAYARELEPQLRRISAGVDHDRPGRAALGADDVAVRPDRSELIRFDRDRQWGVRV
jgi:hypothetical protein